MHSKKNYLITTIIATVLCFSLCSNAQIVINEASNRNFSQLLDEDAEAQDWVELYNNGTEVVNLLAL